MRFRLYPGLRRIAVSLMVLAMAAFVQQGAMITLSRALASAGCIPDPAITLNGPVHFHDHLAGYVHVHGSNNAAGHVHNAADPDDDADGTADMSVWGIGCTSAIIPMMEALPASSKVVSAGDCRHERVEGVEPDGLNRPPSTPSIA